MDVRCPQCETLYELDSSQIKSKVVTLKCSQCQHVFRFESRTSIIQENQRRWMVRNLESGDILYLNSFEVLHKRIMEGQVSRRDEISRTGKKWTLLGDIGEFMPVFQVVDSISSIAGEDSPAAKAVSPVEKELPPSPRAEDIPERQRVSTSIQYGGESAEDVTKRARPERPTTPTPSPETDPDREVSQAVKEEPSVPAATEPEASPRLKSTLDDSSQWAIGGGALEEPSEPIELPSSGRSAWPVVLLVLILAAGGGYYYVANFQPDLLASILEQNPDREVVSIGQNDAGVDAATEQVDVHQVVAGAYAAAFNAQQQQEAGLFESVVRSLRPAMDQALGVATEESEAWAEGGAIDELLVDARRALESGRHARALSIYEEVLGQDGGNVIAITGIGWAYVEQSRSADAVSQFKRALDLNSGYGDAYIGLGTAERQRGNLKAAYDAYDLYLGRHPRGEKASIARYQLEQLRRQLEL